jgi:hypothetical protein
MQAFLKRLITRKQAYQRIFLGDDSSPHKDAEIVLADLKRFCYVERPTIKVTAQQTIDPLAMAVAEGRREVFMRIVQFMRLDDATISALKEPDHQED